MPSALLVADTLPIVTVAPPTRAPVTILVTVPLNVTLGTESVGVGAVGISVVEEEESPPPHPATAPTSSIAMTSNTPLRIFSMR